MNHYKYSDLSVMQITTFISVAHSLSMSRSAQELFISQSTVSKRINEIERVTGVILFERKNNSLELTPAGEKLASELEDIYDRLCSGIYYSKAIQNGYVEDFSICIDTSVDFEVTYNAIKNLKKKYPTLNLVVETDLYNPKKLLINSKVDLAISYYEPYGQNENLLDHHIIKDVPLYAVTNKKSFVGKKDEVELSDLSSESIIIPSEMTRPGYLNNIQYYFKDSKNPPEVKGTVHSTRLEYQPLFDNGVVITTMESIEENGDEALEIMKKELKFFRLKDVFITSSFYWKKGNHNILIPEFISIYEDLLRGAQK